MGGAQRHPPSAPSSPRPGEHLPPSDPRSRAIGPRARPRSGRVWGPMAIPCSTTSRLTSSPRLDGKFELNAKANFIRLQAANDTGNLDDIRQFTTPEMFAELKMELADRNGVSQKTDVVSIHAQVIEVEEDADRYVVSVRFTGVIKTDMGEPDESFDEVWHLTKLRQGSTGWVLSGIQQTP